MKALLDRIKADVGHAGHLGPKSTQRLFTLLDMMVQEIERFDRYIERQNEPPRDRRTGLVGDPQ
jgi:hypothetical protein